MVNHSNFRPRSVILVPALFSAVLIGCTRQEGVSDVPVPPEVPSFKGVASGYVVDGGVKLEWFEADDLQTDRSDLVYTTYVGRDGGPVDLETPVGISLPGATSLVVRDLEPADYRFAVRCSDADGNEDENTAAVRVSLLDEEPPFFDGIVGTIVEDTGTLRVEWNAATDNVSLGHEIRYRIYTSNRALGVYSEAAVAETEPGATHFLLQVEDPGAELWLGVRAVDAAGNEETNLRISSTLQPEDEPPAFAGVHTAVADDEGVLLRWATAVDNATSSYDIVYEVHWSEISGAQDLSRPDLVTEPGVGQVRVAGLEADTRYYFIVRAVDESKNRDRNTVQLDAVTPPLDEEPPTFGGVESVSSQTPRTLTVGWTSATDSTSTSAQISYDVFLATASGGFDFEQPVLTTPPGRGTAELLGLGPDTEYFVAVRARDRAGNSDENTVELAVTTGSLTEDVGAPTLEGSVKVERVPSDPKLLLVSWAGANDSDAAAGDVRAHVCVGDSSSACSADAFFDGYNTTSEWGANSAFVTGLAARSSYFVGVRLEDVAGNMQTKSQVAEGITATSFTRNVEPIIEARCNHCHSYTYGSLVNVPDELYVDPMFGQLYLVDPTSVVNSYLIRKLRARGSEFEPFGSDAPASYYGKRMPSDGSDPLTAETERILIDWIEQGAFLN